MAAKINLLDWRAELRTQRRQQFLTMLGLGAAIAAGGVFLGTYTVNGAIEFQQERNSFLRAQIAEMEKKIKEIEELEKVKANLIARMQVIERLQGSRAAMVHFFDEVLNTLPDGVYLKSLRQAGPQVSIDGVAESNGRVSTYMKNVEASEWFAEPKLIVIKTTEANRKRQAEFQMQFKNLTQSKPKTDPAAADEEAE